MALMLLVGFWWTLSMHQIASAGINREIPCGECDAEWAAEDAACPSGQEFNGACGGTDTEGACRIVGECVEPTPVGSNTPPPDPNPPADHTAFPDEYYASYYQACASYIAWSMEDCSTHDRYPRVVDDSCDPTTGAFPRVECICYDGGPAWCHENH
jgi:hypothetical protein